MKRMISFLLILAFCLSMACPVFATFVPSTQDPPHPDYPNRPNWPDRWWPSFVGENPKTGDIIMFWVVVLAVSVVALGAVYMVYRKRVSK